MQKKKKKLKKRKRDMRNTLTKLKGLLIDGESIEPLLEVLMPQLGAGVRLHQSLTFTLRIDVYGCRHKVNDLVDRCCITIHLSLFPFTETRLELVQSFP